MTFFFCEQHFHGSHRWSSSWRLDLSVFQAPSSNGSPIVTRTVVCLFASKIPGGRFGPGARESRTASTSSTSVFHGQRVLQDAEQGPQGHYGLLRRPSQGLLISKAGGQGTHLVALAEALVWLDPGLDTFLCPPSWVNSAPSQKMRQQKKFLIEAFKIMSLPTLFGQFSIEFFVVALNQTPPHSFCPGFLYQLLQPGSPLDSLLLLTSSIRQNCTNVASLPPYYLYIHLHLYVPARLQGLFHAPLGTALCIPFSAGTFTPKKPCL